MAELPPGEVEGMDLNLVRQQRKLIPYHTLITHLSVCSKVPIGNVCIAEQMLSVVQLAVLLPDCLNWIFWTDCELKVLSEGTLLKASLQAAVWTQPCMCLGARGVLSCSACAAKMLKFWHLRSPAVLHPDICLSVNVHTWVVYRQSVLNLYCSVFVNRARRSSSFNTLV